MFSPLQLLKVCGSSEYFLLKIVVILLSILMLVYWEITDFICVGIAYYFEFQFSLFPWCYGFMSYVVYEEKGLVLSKVFQETFGSNITWLCVERTFLMYFMKLLRVVPPKPEMSSVTTAEQLCLHVFVCISTHYVFCLMIL